MASSLRGRSKSALPAVLVGLAVLPATAQAWKPERAASHTGRSYFQFMTGLAPEASLSACRRTRTGERYGYPGWWTCRTRVRHGGTRGVFRVLAFRGDEDGRIIYARWPSLSVVIVVSVHTN